MVIINYQNTNMDLDTSKATVAWLCQQILALTTTNFMCMIIPLGINLTIIFTNLN
jgi:hypothetical protein